ncbi:MAG: TetR/AcrR family transcriptional regulator [Deltaproteobacteria bacterium]|nr:TetR/AcrR family transcriptional regulator [Deltaproteobacteria bacterium]
MEVAKESNTPLKEKIIFVSTRLFSMNGFLSTSISDILDAVGTSKGGFYNHFKSKEELFYAVLSQSRKIWREQCLAGFDDIESPIKKVEALLKNYCDRYLKDYEHFPGGCIFLTLAVELADSRPHLAEQLNIGFIRLKAMIRRLLEQAKEIGEIRDAVSSERATEVLFSGMLGASVVYGIDKSEDNLHRTICALIQYLQGMRK